MLAELIDRYLPTESQGSLGDLVYRYAVGGVVKPVRQWLKGTVERWLEPLLARYGGKLPEEVLPEIEQRISGFDYADRGHEYLTEQQYLTEQLDHVQRQIAYNQWINRNLGNYVRREMGTETDPVRQFIDENEGDLFFDTDMLVDPYRSFTNRREAEDFIRFTERPNNEFIDDESFSFWRKALEENPWIRNLDPKQEVQWLIGERENPYSHLTDELWNTLRPDTDLPENLRLRPESLSRLSVPDAVRRMNDIGRWRDSLKREANAKFANNPATFTFKEYPEGFRWVELRKPEDTGKIKTSITKDLDEALEADAVDELQYFTPEEMVQYEEALKRGNDDELEHLYELAQERAIENIEFGEGATIYEDEAMAALREALKYEGDTMGHCVGGYCSEVAEGNSRIYSLRDAKGEPHVTVEVDPVGGRTGQGIPSILQIKGKANRAPVEKYLPYVQDFVRSGRWSDVRDLQNTGLLRTDELLRGRMLPEFNRLGDLGLDEYNSLVGAINADAELPPEYMTIDEWLNLINNRRGMKRGGLITSQQQFNPSTLEARLADLLPTIHPRRFAAGGVVKPVRQWLKGSIEKALERYRHRIGGMDPEEAIQRAPQFFAEQDIERATGDAKIRQSVNRWIDSNFANYLRRDFGTEWDPLKDITDKDEGLFTVDELIEQLGDDDPELIASLRADPNLWESAMDTHGGPAEMKAKLFYDYETGQPYYEKKKLFDENPWLAKLSPDDSVHWLSSSVIDDYRFDHMLDELHNAVRPDTDLPEQLRLNPERLSRVSVPDAVRLTRKIDDWRRAQEVEASMRLANNPATFTFKEYPEGFRWVELRKPEDTGRIKEKIFASDGREFHPEVYEQLLDEYRVAKEADGWSSSEIEDAIADGEPVSTWINETYTDSGVSFREEEAIAALREALKYEGDTMGHCVGGYCPDVAEGRSRIYSLRDAKGEPHVTVEVRPGAPDKDPDLEKLDEIIGLNSPIEDWMLSDFAPNFPTPREVLDWAVEKHPDKKSKLEAENLLKQVLGRPDEIQQIKGKANRAPVEKYLPYVQDFVRSGRWGRVGDLQNTGLHRLSDIFGKKDSETYRTLNLKDKFGDYVTDDEIDHIRNLIDRAPLRRAQGGLITDQQSFDPTKLDAITHDLRSTIRARTY